MGINHKIDVFLDILSFLLLNSNSNSLFTFKAFQLSVLAGTSSLILKAIW